MSRKIGAWGPDAQPHGHPANSRSGDGNSTSPLLRGVVDISIIAEVLAEVLRDGGSQRSLLQYTHDRESV